MGWNPVGAFSPRGGSITNVPRLRGIIGGRWVPGPYVGDLAGVAELQVPAGFSFIYGEEVRRYLESIPQPVTGQEIALLVRSGGGWYVIFSFDEIGWVSEQEREKLDPDALLVAIRQMTALMNRDRQHQGWTAVSVLGWAAPPAYDREAHRLEWATDEMSNGRSLLELNARHLGRRGVMRSTLVADPTRFARTLPEYRRVMEGFSFRVGERYSDVLPTDPQASQGLTALVVGGAGAVAVKVGLTSWPWWLPVVVVLVVVLLLLRVDPRRKGTPPRSRAAARPGMPPRSRSRR